MRSRFRRFLAGLAVGLFAAYLLALPPHLVHHLFNDDHGRPACPHLTQSQHTPEIQTNPPTLPLPTEIGTVQACLPKASHSSPVLRFSHPRAPPRPAPSA